MTTLDRRERGRRAERFGRWAEMACRMALRLAGYRILAVRLRTPAGEIDLLARRGGCVAVIEVKGRDRTGQAAEALAPAQQRRLVRAAAHVCSRNPALAALPVRFDVMLVAPWRWPIHLRDAWRPDHQ